MLRLLLLAILVTCADAHGYGFYFDDPVAPPEAVDTVSSWSPGEVPNPLVDPAACGRANASFFCQVGGGWVSPGAADRFDSDGDVNRADPAAQVDGRPFFFGAVWVDEVKEIAADSGIPAKVARFADEVRIGWGLPGITIGTGNSTSAPPPDTSLLLVVSLGDRYLHFSRSPAAAARLTNGEIDSAAGAVGGLLRELKYDDAMGALAALAYLHLAAGVPPPSGGGGAAPPPTTPGTTTKVVSLLFGSSSELSFSVSL